MKSGWIDVKERLPEVRGRYLVCAEDCLGFQRITFAPLINGRLVLRGHCSTWHATHWMPLPALPGGRRGREEPEKSRSRHYSKRIY